MKLVNLGCGADIRQGYINIDARKGRGVDVVMDIRNKLPFGSGSVDGVVAWDVLEHLTYWEQEKILGEIFRILKSGGRLEVRIPNIEDIISRFEDDPETRNLFLYGDTSTYGSWGAHKSGHTLKSFLTLCRMEGFEAVEQKKENTNWLLKLKKCADGKIIKADDKRVWVLKEGKYRLGKSMWGKLTGRAIVWVENKPVTGWIKYRLFGFLADEVAVADKAVHDSLFPKTHISAARVMIGRLPYQIKRALARKMVEKQM